MLTKKVIRHNVGENKVSFAQTSKGLWYCTELTMYCKDPLDGISYLSGAMLVVEEVLKERNTPSIPPSKERKGEIKNEL